MSANDIGATVQGVGAGVIAGDRLRDLVARESDGCRRRCVRGSTKFDVVFSFEYELTLARARSAVPCPGRFVILSLTELMM